MTKLRIVHLFNFSRGSRYHSMISQGLHAHPGVDASYAMPFVSLGSVVRQPDPHLHDSLMHADYIFRCDDEHFGFDDIDRFLDDNRLWSKVVYYDKKDSPDIDMHRLDTCCAYIKRSWTIGSDRTSRPPLPRPLFPLDFSLLSEYFSVEVPAVKDIDVAFLFSPIQSAVGQRRYRVYTELQKRIHMLGNSVIGRFTSGAREGRRAIFNPPDKNPFLEYLKALKRSRIIFTAYPEPWDGDSRTWEAFSSQALVFMDRTTIPSPHPMIHGKHCFVYDARYKQSIASAIEKAAYFLDHEEERREIAMDGYRYACSHHQPLNRIEQVLNWVQSPVKKLEEHVKPEPPGYFSTT